MTPRSRSPASPMSYGDREVLTGVDFEVKTGEVFCLLGPNGAGKTTTVEILEGFRQRTGGNGQRPRHGPAGAADQAPRADRHRPAGMRLPAAGPGGGADRLLARLLPQPAATWKTCCRSWSSPRTGTSRCASLSGGQRRRLDLALALAGDPDLIFLDEPTTGFDPESRRRCWAAIENLRTLGKTIVLTTHYLDEAERLADRVAILHDGRSRSRARCGTSPGRRG